MRNDKKQDIVESFTNAFRGLFYALKTERNLCIHFAIGCAVIIGGIFFRLPFLEFLILIMVVTMVIITEIFNTVVEMFSDMLYPQYYIQVRKIKDVAASAVLISAITSVIIGYLLFAKYFPPSFRNAFENLANSPWYLTFLVLFFISSLYIVLKSIIRKQALISGGMPSIHSGIAFSIWVIVSMLTFRSEPLVSVLVLLLAIWVAQGRVIKRIHTVEETVIGAIFGILITVLLIQLVEKFKIIQ
ncbi:MAG TPA: diacylglycerol kinase [bacterium]|nr:diacylglycerol kinase [bacterium]HOL35897.1 diacylglycerol kinase [bacterium]HPP09161.1 diacylglycerol kinase [bacterium]